jgi:hypothetical protein
MKTLFFLFIFSACGAICCQAQNNTKQTITTPASLKADTVNKVTYTYKGKLYTQQEFIDSVCIKLEKNDTEYVAMTDFLKAKNETDVLNTIKNKSLRFRIYESKIDPAALAKEVEESTKNAKASEDFRLLTDTTTILKPQKITLRQLSKDVENKVVDSEQKYVEFVDKYPELKTDEKVRVMYEKCKSKIKKK